MKDTSGWEDSVDHELTKWIHSEERKKEADIQGRLKDYVAQENRDQEITCSYF